MHGHIQEKEFGDVLLDESETPIAAQVRDVVHRTGDEVVNADDLVSARQQQIGEMRAEKAGGAGHHGSGRGETRGAGFSWHGWARVKLQNPKSKPQISNHQAWYRTS